MFHEEECNLEANANNIAVFTESRSQLNFQPQTCSNSQEEPGSLPVQEGMTVEEIDDLDVVVESSSLAFVLSTLSYIAE